MIHWFPGHMHKEMKSLKRTFPNFDIAIEVVDSRAPSTTINPVLHQIANKIPVIKVLSKKDLADPLITKEWLTFYKGKAIAINIHCPRAFSNTLFRLCIKLYHKSYQRRFNILKPINLVVIGLPNVGKSTLVNVLANRKITETGNEPAVTKRQQKIEVNKGFYLYDTPGIMFPSPRFDSCGYKLAIVGTIKDTAMDYISATSFLIEYMKKFYPFFLKKLFKTDDLDVSNDILLERISQYTGKKNIHNVSENIIHNFRRGRIGRISLERPSELPFK